jgi:hypothetical protein
MNGQENLVGTTPTGGPSPDTRGKESRSHLVVPIPAGTGSRNEETCRRNQGLRRMRGGPIFVTLAKVLIACWFEPAKWNPP